MGDCSDAERDWFPQRTVCHKTMARASAMARYGARHEKWPYHDGTFSDWAEKRDAEHPFHFNDGVTVWVHDTDLRPDDDFLGSGSPVDDDHEKG